MQSQIKLMDHTPTKAFSMKLPVTAIPIIKVLLNLKTTGILSITTAAFNLMVVAIAVRYV